MDQALEVVDEYQQRILKLEHDVLIKPKMRTVRSCTYSWPNQFHLIRSTHIYHIVHIMSGDLTLHKRTLDPIKTLVYGLRRYDVDRCAALINASGDANSQTKIEGFMSHKSKIYLADVYDHIDYILNSMDMFSSISENLINYTFNVRRLSSSLVRGYTEMKLFYFQMASYEMNEVM